MAQPAEKLKPLHQGRAYFYCRRLTENALKITSDMHQKAVDKSQVPRDLIIHDAALYALLKDAEKRKIRSDVVEFGKTLQLQGVSSVFVDKATEDKISQFDKDPGNKQTIAQLISAELQKGLCLDEALNRVLGGKLRVMTYFDPSGNNPRFWSIFPVHLFDQKKTMAIFGSIGNIGSQLEDLVTLMDKAKMPEMIDNKAFEEFMSGIKKRGKELYPRVSAFARMLQLARTYPVLGGCPERHLLGFDLFGNDATRVIAAWKDFDPSEKQLLGAMLAKDVEEKKELAEAMKTEYKPAPIKPLLKIEFLIREYLETTNDMGPTVAEKDLIARVLKGLLINGRNPEIPVPEGWILPDQKLEIPAAEKTEKAPEDDFIFKPTPEPEIKKPGSGPSLAHRAKDFLSQVTEQVIDHLPGGKPVVIDKATAVIMLKEMMANVNSMMDITDLFYNKFVELVLMLVEANGEADMRKRKAKDLMTPVDPSSFNRFKMRLVEFKDKCALNPKRQLLSDKLKQLIPIINDILKNPE